MLQFRCHYSLSTFRWYTSEIQILILRKKHPSRALYLPLCWLLCISPIPLILSLFLCIHNRKHRRKFVATLILLWWNGIPKFCHIYKISGCLWAASIKKIVTQKYDADYTCAVSFTCNCNTNRYANRSLVLIYSQNSYFCDLVEINLCVFLNKITLRKCNEGYHILIHASPKTV